MRYFLLTLFFISTMLYAKPAREIFLTPEGGLTEDLIALLKLDGLYESGDTLQDAVRKTQEHWLAVTQGKNGKERADLRDSDHQRELCEKVEEIALRMGLFSEQIPTRSHYDYGICLGGFVETIQHHLARLVALWEEGIRFDSLVFLAGERDLRLTSQDSVETLCTPHGLPFKEGWQFPEDAPYKTEYDLAIIVWEQSLIPETMAQALEGKVYFVNASRGNAARPSTKDTYVHWLKEYRPKPGSALATSYPLLWAYQQLAAETVLREAYFLETVAEAASEEMMKKNRKMLVSLVLDTVAKCLYEIHFVCE
jgi:hypothetical protein